MEETKKRIINGIKFFRMISGEEWDSAQVKHYLPKFLDLIEKYLGVAEPEQKTTPQIDLYSQTKDIFGEGVKEI